ncbi:hypothetical protein AYO22_08405 [Fonsecaea multimorphosa]|nr:hypothetical protein AYO22_08405 [Fonsecaea multimorphosa]
MEPKVTYSDLVIVGAGPAGLMAASWASRLGLNARILDDKPDRIQNGRADGLHVRTMEILDSFGMATRINEAAYHLREICSWNPDPEDENKLQRTQRILAKEEEYGRFCQQDVHQGFIEQNFLDFLEREGRVHVERDIKTTSLRLDEDNSSPPEWHIFPILTVTADGSDEEIKTKYLLGTDGGHSWTREQIGLEIAGGKTKAHFGVMDIIPITDFPDIRVSCSIHSAKTGSMMTVPRENRLVRFYIQLAETGSEGDDFDTAKVTLEMIAQKAAKILSPFHLRYEYCDWWSVYTVGQQCAPRFDRDNRVFLAGDAVHTHSPTMGAGMNVSMQDTYNLVWKLGQVIQGIAQPQILRTYNDERQSVATRLIELDQEMCKFYEKGPGSDAHHYNKFYAKFRTFLSGAGVEYGPNILIPRTHKEESSHSEPRNGFDRKSSSSLTSRQSLASNIIVGRRLPSHLVLNHAEANIVHVHSMLKSDGRWRLLVLPGNIAEETPMARLKGLCQYLDSASSFLRTYTPDNEKLDSVIEVLTIHAASRSKLELSDLPEILHPFDPKLGDDYWKCFVNNNAGEEGAFDDAYERWGVDKKQGCLVVVRPDQHVSFICGVEEIDQVARYFDQILVPQRGKRECNCGH